MSLLSPDGCGFVKAFVFQQLKDHGKNYSLITENCEKSFEHMRIERNGIKKRGVALKEQIQKIGKSNPEGKKCFLDFFSTKKWEALSNMCKKRHSIFNCFECTTKHRCHMSLLPTSRQLEKTRDLDFQIHIPRNSSLSEITQKVYQQVNKKFEQVDTL